MSDFLRALCYILSGFLVVSGGKLNVVPVTLGWKQKSQTSIPMTLIFVEYVVFWFFDWATSFSVLLFLLFLFDFVPC